MFPSFFFADFKGAYSYIQTEWMLHFWEIVHSGGMNPDIDNWGDIKKMSEDSNPIYSIMSTNNADEIRFSSSGKYIVVKIVVVRIL